MRRAPAVGTDVVELSTGRFRGRGCEPRFAARVLAASEAAAVRAAPHPDLELAALWACKEAAFKVVTKLEGRPPVFRHAAFVVTLTPGDAQPRTGIVHYGGREAAVAVCWSADTLRAVAAAHDGGDDAGQASAGATVTAPVSGATSTGVGPASHGADTHQAGSVRSPHGALALVHHGVARVAEVVGSSSLPELLSRFTEKEADAVRDVASAAVRLAARAALAQGLAVDEGRVEIVCAPGPVGRRPPFVHLDGRPTPLADVSLSHDGAWVAWAYGLAEG